VQAGHQAVQGRVGKTRFFFKKNPAQWFFWVLLVFFGFFGFFCFLLFFIYKLIQKREFLGFFSVSRILLGASRLQILITLTLSPNICISS
jgi:hypothetical protein